MKKTHVSAIAAMAAVGAISATALTVTGAQAAPRGTSAHQATSSATAPAKKARAKKDKGYTPPPIEWAVQCEDPRLQKAGARCGLLTVPLNYDKPKGTKIKLALSVVSHKTSDAAAQGIMLVNPGGPGGSGLSLSRLGASVPNQGGDPYDWIGFDPRGVGKSQPSLSCDENYNPTNRPDYVPMGANIKNTEQYWRGKAANYAKACKRAGGPLLNHMKTTDWVNDMESIRKAFGQKKINYYGFSYGTYLGQVYATKHPYRVRRFVFDGVVNPQDAWYKANLQQDKAFEFTEQRFFDWVAERNATYGLGATGTAVANVFKTLLAKSRQAPLGGTIGPDELTDAFLSAGYYVFDWASYAETLQAAAEGDYEPVQDLYGNPNGPGSDNTYAVYNAVQCTDAPWPNWKVQRKDNRKLYNKGYQFETWANAWYNAPCLTWKAKSNKAAPKVDGSRVSPILMIEETFDAATPYKGARVVRNLFPRSRLIEGVGGTTHAGSLSGVACTDDRIANYLLTGALDKRQGKKAHSDVQCPPVLSLGTDVTGRHATSGRTATTGLSLPADLRRQISSFR